MKTYTLHGFIIKRQNWGEADKLVTLFSRERGKLRLAAKGVRRIHSRRAGSLELFNQVELLAVESRTQLDIITETHLLKMYTSFSANFLKTQMVYQLVELVDKLTPEDQPHEEMFDLLVKVFRYFDEADLDSSLAERALVRFKVRILDLLGFGTPPIHTQEVLHAYIEGIIEKKLVARASFEI